VLPQDTATELSHIKCNCADRQGSIGCCYGCFQVPDHLNCMILNAFSWQGQKARRLWCRPCFLHSTFSSCRTISTRSMLGPACRACVTEGALGLHEPVGHAGMCCQASYMPCSHYRSASRSKAAWWADVNLTSVQRSDGAPDEGRFGFADALLTIGSQRTTQVKHKFNAKVPQVVAPEPPPR
jgi:hypothetical protein